MSLIVDNILDMISHNGEAETLEDISTFECPMNSEVVIYLKKNAIDFAKKKLSVTYLVSDSTDGEIVGYFTLAHKVIEVRKGSISSKIEKRMSRFAPFDETNKSYTFSSFLLAQFSKNYAVDDGKRIDGCTLMDLADEVMRDVQHKVGGGYIYLDVLSKNDGVVKFYKDNYGYHEFNKRVSSADGNEYTQMIRAI